MKVEIGQVWKDIAGGKSRIVEIEPASWGIVYVGEPLGDPKRLLHYARSDLVELVSEAALTQIERQASGFSPRSERTGRDGLLGGKLPSVATTVPNSSFAIRQLEPSTKISGNSPSRMGVREVGALLNESAQADAVGHGRPVEGIPAINGGEDVKDNDVEAEALENLLNDEGDTYAVFSLSRTYDSEPEARAAAMKYAQTGGVWHVAKVIGSAVPREPEWRVAV